jgi:WD40 repeat protein
LLASGGASAKWGQAEVKLWDLRTRAELASLPGVADPVHGLAFSPDGKTVALGDIEGRVFLWDVASKQVRRCLKGHTSVGSVVWSRDGKRLVSGGNDIRIWGPATGELLRTLPVGDNTDDCNGLAISKDGTLLASGSHRGNIRVWQTATGEARLTLRRAPPNGKPTWKPIRELKEPETNVYCVAFSPDDTLLAAGVGPTVRIWDIKALLAANTGAGGKPSK